MNLGIIQAHMASQRLPGKILKKMCGKEVLLHVFDRLLKADTLDEIIVATSVSTENDVLRELCNTHGIRCFSGSEKNVLHRFFECNKLYRADYIVRITSDCPLLEPKLIDYWMTHCIEDQLDFVEEEKNLYTGFGVDIFSGNTLDCMYERATLQRQKEHVVGYYYDHPEEFRHRSYALPDELHYLYRSYRLTLDTEPDYALLSLLYEKFYKDGYADLREIMYYLDAHSEVLSENEHVQQKNYFEE